ncbi:MAG: hypothetical protein LBB48_00990 [Treponema sp.]|jgi:hypothetical protein|nr:hypothetical protein [Treponema sp.]
MKTRFFLLVGSAFLLTSCVLAEQFTCDITIGKSGTYSVEFKGTMVFYGVFEEIAENGEVSQETNADIRSFFDDAIKEEPAVRNYEYRNNGRAYIEYFKEINDGSSLDLSSSGLPLVISVDDDAFITVTVPATNRKDKEKLEAFTKQGYRLDGTIKITSELPVIDSGGQKVGNKYFLFGPKVISRTVTVNTLLEEDIVVILGNAQK